MHSTPRTYQSAVIAFRKRRAASAERRALITDLGEFTSQADLVELSEILRRHDDATATVVRDAIDWTRAA